MFSRDLPIVNERVRNFHFRKTVKIANQLAGMFVGQTERRHPYFKPRTDRYRRLQKTKKPVRLYLFTLAIEHGRRERRILLIVLTNKTAAPFDLVTADAIVLLHQASTLEHLLNPKALIGQVTLGHLPFTETTEQDAQRFYVFVGEIELRHQLLDPLRRVSARRFQLVISPIVPGGFDIGAVAEREFFHSLGAKGTQFGADARFLF